jgi:hypothetical protein
MIHSTSAWHRGGLPPAVTYCETRCPFELFTMVAVPLVEVASEIVIVTESPALKEMPSKLTQPDGNHSNQACVMSARGRRCRKTSHTAVAYFAGLHRPVDATLKNGLSAGITIDANPSSARVGCVPVATGWRRGRRDCERPSDASDVALDAY